MASFEIHCPTCNKKVTATTLLGGSDLTSALTSDAPIKVIHLTEDQGDHIWTIGIEERKNLANVVAKELVRWS
jgi:hypothetical protein